MGCIYLIRNTINGKCYIGQTVHDAVKQRIPKHLNGHGNSIVKRAVAKYGKDAFTFQILHDGIIPELLNSFEIEAIQRHNTVKPNGYNIANGGNSKGKHTAETRRKISNSAKGRKHTPESRRKMSESSKGSTHNKGRKHTPEHRSKISDANKGKKHSPETRQKMREAKKGYVPWNKGEKHSPEALRKMSESQTRRWAKKRAKQKS